MLRAHVDDQRGLVDDLEVAYVTLAETVGHAAGAGDGLSIVDRSAGTSGHQQRASYQCELHPNALSSWRITTLGQFHGPVYLVVRASVGSAIAVPAAAALLVPRPGCGHSCRQLWRRRVGSGMDILTEVADALQLHATGARRLTLDAEHVECVGDREALAALPVEGACTLTTAAGPVELLPEDYALLVGRQEASFGADASCRLIVCRYGLQTDLPHPLARQLPTVLTLGSRFLTDRTEFGRAVTSLDSELANTRLGSEFVACRLAEVAFIEVLRRVQLDERARLPFLTALSDPTLLRSLELIHAAPDRAWRVEDLAERAGLSRAAFAERFHREVGEPPLRYLRAWRLLRARRQIAAGGVRVRDVAHQAGYGTANGFSRAFRRFFGHSPNTLRVH